MSNNPDTFTSYQEAVNALERSRYDGLGVGVFDGLCAVDIDDCLDEDGTLSPLSSLFASTRKDRGAILSVEAVLQGGSLRPLSAGLIIPHGLWNNKWVSCGSPPHLNRKFIIRGGTMAQYRPRSPGPAPGRPAARSGQ